MRHCCSPPPISKEALAALDAQPPMKIAGQGPTSEQTTWRNYFDRLLVDADVQYLARSG